MTLLSPLKKVKGKWREEAFRVALGVAIKWLLPRLLGKLIYFVHLLL